MDAGAHRTAEELLDGFPDSLRIFDAVKRAVEEIGDVTIQVTKSQVAFRRHKGFAYVWRPGQYVRSDVPAVLSIALPYEVVSDRFKSVVHPSGRGWMHHIELRDVGQVDDQLRGWLARAYAAAGERPTASG